MIKKYILNKYFLLLVIAYFLLRIINLTKLPIFNDESIYLDWGWREINTPGYLYYSLYDAKQPLLMWFFGIAQILFKDPLFAGRLVSVFCGFLSLVGIYKLSQKLFDTKTAFIASLFYSIIPIFSFYDRQALMESSIATVGIWTIYFILNLFEKKDFRSGIFIGIILGIGFFIKSSSLIFLISYLILTLYLVKISSKKTKIFEITFVSVVIFLAVIILLLINPLFWDTFKTNSRFTLTLGEIFSLPVYIWVQSILTNFKILFFYLTPIVFLGSILGFFYIFKDSKNFKIFTLFFIICILLETFTVRQASDRYLLPFVTFFIIPFARIAVLLLKKNKNLGISFFIVSLLVPLSLTFYQVINPPSYIISMGKISGYTNSAYLSGFTSGYGINDVLNYFNKISSSEKIVIGIAENTGNPESAINIYFNKNKNVKVVYFDSRLFDMDLSNYDCLKTNSQVYFVSRDNQLVGLDKFLEKIKTIKNPYGTNTIGIYKLKTKCSGKVLEINPKKTT
ncbi:MAG TPA: glycosyltransferase family 39 protein [Candidatus Sulfotelmatobacter sp.]|nr:glycosyltransferase family 39 protein [Candidatus Sulfotelmatobacter sp.]